MAEFELQSNPAVYSNNNILTIIWEVKCWFGAQNIIAAPLMKQKTEIAQDIQEWNYKLFSFVLYNETPQLLIVRACDHDKSCGIAYNLLASIIIRLSETVNSALSWVFKFYWQSVPAIVCVCVSFETPCTGCPKKKWHYRNYPVVVKHRFHVPGN